MSLTFLYGDRRGAFSVSLGTSAVRLGGWSLGMSAEMGQPDSSTLAIDDPTGTAGYLGDQILGLKTLVATESAAPANNRRIYTGYIGDRTYESADSLNTGAAVRITMDLHDLNEEATYHVITGKDGKRPRETVGARLTWLIASTYIALSDTGYVVYPTTYMDANDYRNQTCTDVLNDCAQAAGYNWFLLYDESGARVGLWFDDPNTSTAYTSTLRLSNVLANVDSSVKGGDGATHTWAPIAPALHRSPQTTASGVVMPWSKGTKYLTRAGTATTYGYRDVTAADANVRTSAAATLRVNRLLWENRNEEDLITCSVDLPVANVNDIREGQRLSAKFRQLPGYKSAYSWFRVLHRSVGQSDMTDQFYRVDLSLSPVESAGGAPVQTATERHQDDVTFGSQTTVGNLLITFQSWRQLLTSPRPPLGETWTLIGTGSFVDDHDAPDPCAIVCYATIVTSAAYAYTKQAATGGSSNGTVVHSTTYELSGVAIGDLTAYTSGPNAPSLSLDIGSIGYLASGQYALAAWGNGYDGAFVDAGTQTTNPGSWTRDFYASRDYDTTSSNSLYGAGFPFTWYGHVTGSGTTIEALTSIDAAHSWGGVAVKVG